MKKNSFNRTTGFGLLFILLLTFAYYLGYFSDIFFSVGLVICMVGLVVDKNSINKTVRDINFCLLCSFMLFSLGFFLYKI